MNFNTNLVYPVLVLGRVVFSELPGLGICKQTVTLWMLQFQSICLLLIERVLWVCLTPFLYPLLLIYIVFRCVNASVRYINANDSRKGLKKLIHFYFFNILRKIRSYIQDFLGGRKLSLLIVSRLVGKKPLPVSGAGAGSRTCCLLANWM